MPRRPFRSPFRFAPPAPALFALLTCGLLLALGPAVVAQESTREAQGAAEVPTFAQIAGHDFGERITVHGEMMRYLEALDEASPRVRVTDQGTSWEGRALPVAAVSSPENLARLEEIRRGSAALADPRSLSPEAAGELIAGSGPVQPVVVWMGGSIHGFELSGAEGLLKLLEHLTTRNDPETLEVLDRVVVLIDPMINPDGRDAFAHFNHQRLSGSPNADRSDWANDTSFWEALQFRTGHYFFDTNRDWFAQTQAETRARVPTLLSWKPQVMVDLHEMGADAEFFFDPPDDPVAPFYPDFATSWYPRFGAAYARAFDRAGFEYMTGERYNYFYPGYTSSWGGHQGAVSMLFEQGSSRGLALERPDGSVRTLADALEQQYTAAWATLRLSAEERQELLRGFYEGRRQALAGGLAPDAPGRYLVSAARSPAEVRALAQMLTANGIEVGVLNRGVRLADLGGRYQGRSGEPVDGDRELPAGSLVVDACQPGGGLVHTLLGADQPVPEAFLEEARHRVDRAENPRFYDITGWSLPLLFNLETFAGPAGAALDTTPWERWQRPAPALPEAGYAYLLDGQDPASMAALQDLLEAGVRAAVLTGPTRLGGEPVPAGTVIVRTGQNRELPGAESLHGLVARVAERWELSVRAVDSGLGDPGFPALGSGDFTLPARSGEIALLAEGSLNAYSFGWHWYLLTERWDLPVTVLRTGSIAGTPLERFDVLVVPDSFGNLAGALGEAGVERLQRWVRDGGILVASGASVDFVRQGLDMAALRSWEEAQSGAEDGPVEDAARPATYDVPGAVFDARVDLESWLAAGLPDEHLPVLVFSDRIYLAPEGPPRGDRQVAIRFAGGTAENGEGEEVEGEGPVLLSGHAWPETVERLPGSVFAYAERQGRGGVVLFAEDLSFRGYWRGADRLLLNAVLLGPTAF